VPATLTIRPTRVFVVQEIVQRQNHSMVIDFIIHLAADICCLICQKNIRIGQQLPKLQQML